MEVVLITLCCCLSVFEVILAYKVIEIAKTRPTANQIADLAEGWNETQIREIKSGWRELESEWESTYAKFQRLYSRACRQRQEDEGKHQGGANARGLSLVPPKEGLSPEFAPSLENLTRAQLLAIGRTWPTSSRPKEEGSSQELSGP